ncbi:ImmA/IrrE family metallo-endopeptidase [Paenibacillus apiarius]|uniref:ImmA/IrrE family metallo-endopeptidase n=1 Tax=Paenibacillus apiarius TaxID=46240 RepID=A0ABT4DR93_9BACL|nr:ImmA/IrrE family metallo-endopeptidase [Paenibacillus apiarius]MCY9516724.1 ImmA/IrrE family metallo-endopeptidase [Paenibacillus apiarius]MCY9519878.1 ImmA/IrrE family metallo-endopeptidase [Paenibacillus apiarius]MCY9553884.1 ImmA/IrrE family metallo-endopeptidase [Paenibacillus apiarius]MCY9557508.1 ImmA/IrrE family metallo-endopeptidase [Paenibacillus apiarius]MCY9685468.1 ImmA/IrrE family metallo-endopeptidase [Paenibacillus apiarius]
MDVEKIVRSLIRKYKTNCPFLLAQHVNIQVQLTQLGNSTRGFYFRKLRRRYIVINSDLPFEWQRFVCAHELAHDRLHKGVGHFFIERHTLFQVGKFERQANQFALQLLLADQECVAGETREIYCARNGIPPEMAKFLPIESDRE